MANYSDDRSFTDYVHNTLAIPLIYQKLGWQQAQVPARELQLLDLNHGVDYIFTNLKNNRLIKVQERFREITYQKYSDCTLRYRRDHNADPTKHKSEFFKIDADCLVYGITNGYKTPHKRAQITGFVKFAVINLRVLFRKIDSNQIQLQENLNTSKIEGSNLLIPINQNHDSSSSFVAFDIAQLNQLFGAEQIILYQEGFY